MSTMYAHSSSLRVVECRTPCLVFFDSKADANFMTDTPLVGRAVLANHDVVLDSFSVRLALSSLNLL